MGESLCVYHSNKSLEPGVITTAKVHKGSLVASASKNFSRTLQCITSMKKGILGSGVAGDIAVFLLTTAALEAVRRLSKARCPFVWRGLQALQLLCFPPFRWIQRWAPFKGLAKHMQVISRPMLALSIATLFSDEPPYYSSDDSHADSESQSETTTVLSSPGTRSSNEVSRSLASRKWLLDLHEEFDKQGITLTERLDEDELRRYYAAVNGDFSRLTLSVKKTIHWRQTYNFLSLQELESWSRFVFWHGCDVKLRPCLVIHLGLACANLNSSNKPLFARAVVSQIEHGVMNLVDKRHPQITVLMDCNGLSPFGFPMQTMRSCAILLQDHYPRRLACLTVIRLPAIARVITQTLFQVLKPATRKKLRIVGKNYPEVLTEFLQTVPLFLGGTCSCSKCSSLGDIQSRDGETIQSGPGVGRINDRSPEMVQRSPSENSRNDMNYVSPHFDYDADTSMSRSRDRDQVIRTATIVGMAILLMLIAFISIAGVEYRESLPFLHWQSGL